VSWPLASFTVVGVVLLVGWLAYERAAPSARMVAVVGTLAAVAALGRDAFVALPDVKPITAMTFVVGYALGPLPGFMVGAVGMLASNMLLGQGPYTPWQMAAWGLVGLAGAGLGRVSRRRMGRLELAVACALAALAAKEIMNVYTWTIGASHTPAALLVAVVAGLPYDGLDTVASFLFGLAFAPELARLLTRVRTRMEVTWEPTGAAVLGIAIVVLVMAGVISGGAPARATSFAAERIERASQAVDTAHGSESGSEATTARVQTSRQVTFLKAAQNADGGFGGARGQASTELYSAWVAMGLAASRTDPASIRRDGHSVLNALRAEASTLQGPGDLERTILALRACGASTFSLEGHDLVTQLLHSRASDGSFGGLVNITSFAVFALRAAGRGAGDPVVRAAGRWLNGEQNPDGGFGFAVRGGPSDVDDTAAALQGLVDAGVRGTSIGRAAGFLIRAQNPDGGYPQENGGQSNAQSTSWAIQGLVSAGRKVSSVHREGSLSPLGYLESLIAPDGSVRYSRTGAQTPVWVTAQVLTALAEAPFPISPVRAGGRRARSSRAAQTRLDDIARAVGGLAGLALGPAAR
jgi:energy-coupling factor transport system substrate-specific component